jgi:hypothetical protein
MNTYDAQKVDELLQALDPNRSYTDRRDAALDLAEFKTSNPEIVRRLLRAQNSDPNHQIRQLAEAALDKPAHQKVLAENPGMLEEAEGAEVGQPMQGFGLSEDTQGIKLPEGMEPACQKCSRADETLAVVQYPYAFSLIFVTFRRNFAGLWCRKHQMQYRVLAGLITSIFGWLGIPYGFIFTPVYLFKLAGGGEVFTDATIKILSDLAEIKTQQGDREGAIRCLEQRLRYGEDEETRAKLNRLRPQLALEEGGVRSRDRLLRSAAVLLAAMAIGTLIGVLDIASTFLLSPLTTSVDSIFMAIISWAPFVGLIFIGGLLLFNAIEWGLIRAKQRRSGVAIFLGVIAAVLAIYALLQVEAVFGLLLSLNTPGLFVDEIEMMVYVIATLLVGGPFMVLDMIEVGTASDIIFLILLFVTTVYYLFFSVRTARETAKWQDRLAESYDSGPRLA